MSEVIRDRQQEEEFFRSAKPPDLPDEVIRKLQLHIDADGDLVFLFENAERRYALCIVLVNHTRLGWKECQAINDVMKIASRGTHIDNPTFTRLVEQLKSKYGKVQDPNFQNGRLTAVVIPGQGTIRTEKRNTILYTAINFDRDNDLVFSASTNDDRLYRVCLELTLPENCLLNLDCKAFVDILTMLEAGDRLSPDQFLACGAVLRKKYNFVTPSVPSSGHSLSVTVYASRISNTKEIPSVFQSALKRVSAAPPSVAQDRPSANDCPYPDIVYTRAIKEGGQGQVYAGKRKSGERVAVKVFLDQEGAAEAYKTELRMLLKMSQHRNVVEVLDFFETPSPALVMRLIDGEDLMDYLRANGPFSEAEGRKLSIGIAEGLCHLHRHGIIHRDLKSANIIRQRDGTPVLIDLGLGSVMQRNSRRANGSMTQTLLGMTEHNPGITSSIRGSFPWMAPEMITSQEWSDRTDVYSFGIIMWEIFSGKTPFVEPGENVNPMSLLFRIAKGERPSMEMITHLSQDLLALIEACWDTTPKKRPSMRRVLDILHKNDPRRIFRSIDVNNSGGLDFAEFVNFLQRYAPGRVEISQMAGLFAAVDEDDSGEIGIEEFEQFWREVEMSGLNNVVENSRLKKVYRG